MIPTASVLFILVMITTQADVQLTSKDSSNESPLGKYGNRHFHPIHICFNASRIRNATTLHPSEEEEMTNSGKFYCPEEGQDPDFTECCGNNDAQYCCSPWDTTGMKWGIAIGVIIAVFVFMALGYTIQVFRACDRCYHEYPICGEPDEAEFYLDTRWYTVSHEGNRYGVTFHSKTFATHFMQLLERRYGPWNTANILRIKRDSQVFVILHIFFNDLFTPWFYTQGPIKNDEEWIRSDFKDLCFQTKCDLSVNIFKCCDSTLSNKHKRQSEASGGSKMSNLLLDGTNVELVIVPPDDEDTIKEDPSSSLNNSTSNPAAITLVVPDSTTKLPSSSTCNKRDYRPWTKHTFKMKSTDSGARRYTGQYQRHSTASDIGHGHNCNYNSDNTTTVIFDDIIECYGNDKCIQTKRIIIETKT